MKNRICLRCGKPITGKYAGMRKYHKGECAALAHKEQVQKHNEEYKKFSKERTIKKRNGLPVNKKKIIICAYCGEPITDINKGRRKYHGNCALLVHHEQIKIVNKRNKEFALKQNQKKSTLHTKGPQS